MSCVKTNKYVYKIRSGRRLKIYLKKTKTSDELEYIRENEK